MNRFITATEARKNFYGVIDEAEHPGFAVAVTHEGVPKVVVMSFEEYESWKETMEIMADPEFRADMDEAAKELREGKIHDDTVSLEEVMKSLRR